ncbi:rCG63614 [Rattus norvegicus]|uniref:RCG63614 n=1 Tax=Rattus norvegicus TaxID=10116 RepID=A6JMG1_RAT|nr:rCG63614 [Rattus norvegicus]
MIFTEEKHPLLKSLQARLTGLEVHGLQSWDVADT